MDPDLSKRGEEDIPDGAKKYRQWHSSKKIRGNILGKQIILCDLKGFT